MEFHHIDSTLVSKKSNNVSTGSQCNEIRAFIEENRGVLVGMAAQFAKKNGYSVDFIDDLIAYAQLGVVDAFRRLKDCYGSKRRNYILKYAYYEMLKGAKLLRAIPLSRKAKCDRYAMLRAEAIEDRSVGSKLIDIDDYLVVIRKYLNRHERRMLSQFLCGEKIPYLRRGSNNFLCYEALRNKILNFV